MFSYDAVIEAKSFPEPPPAPFCLKCISNILKKSIIFYSFFKFHQFGSTCSIFTHESNKTTA